MSEISELYRGELALLAHCKFGNLDITQLAYAYFIVWQSVCLTKLFAE